MLHDHRRAFRRFNIDLDTNPYVNLRVSPARMRRVLAGPELTNAEVDDLFQAVDYTRDGHIDFLQWCDFLALLRLGGNEGHAAASCVRTRKSLTPEGLFALLSPAATVALTADEQERLKAILLRADKLAQAATRCKVSIMVCVKAR